MYELKRWLARTLEVTRIAALSSVQHFASYKQIIQNGLRPNQNGTALGLEITYVWTQEVAHTDSRGGPHQSVALSSV